MTVMVGLPYVVQMGCLYDYGKPSRLSFVSCQQFACNVIRSKDVDLRRVCLLCLPCCSPDPRLIREEQDLTGRGVVGEEELGVYG